MIKVLELFAGIGACSKALEKLGIEHEIVDAVEIDKYAIASFNAIHGTNFEPQDITKWDKDIQVDLIMHGSPCQDFSLAGKQAGGDEGSGTRSSLMYETIRIVEKLKPKYVVWENVKNLLSKKHKHNFDAYIETMNILGYNSYYQVLNAKDYGIPQNRERVFTISIRKDIDNGNFKFPEKQELKLRLKDMLEDEVNEKYYLSSKTINTLLKYNKDYETIGISPTLTTELAHSTGKNLYPKLAREIYAAKDPKCVQVGNLHGGKWDKINESCRRVYSGEGISPTVHTCQGGNTEPKVLINNATKKGYLEACEGDGIDISSRMQYHRGNVQKGMIQTLDCTGGNSKGVVENDLRIRKLTPKECWRLMGFDDEDFEKAEKVNSNTQLYKQAGNSIVVNVLERILENLLNTEV